MRSLWRSLNWGGRTLTLALFIGLMTAPLVADRYVISVLISLLGGLIFISRTPRRAIVKRIERRKQKRVGEREPSPGSGRA